MAYPSDLMLAELWGFRLVLPMASRSDWRLAVLRGYQWVLSLVHPSGLT